MTTYDPRTIEVVRCFVDGFWNDLPSRRLNYSAPDVDLWLDDAEEQGLLRREPSVMSAIDGSTVLVASAKGARAVKLHDEEQERAAHVAELKPSPDAELAPAVGGPMELLTPKQLCRIYGRDDFRTVKKALEEIGAKQPPQSNDWLVPAERLPSDWREKLKID
jgi:hypothetical protein